MTKKRHGAKPNALRELTSSPLPDVGAELLALGRRDDTVNRRDSALKWFAGIDSKPGLVPALALLWVADKIADRAREVNIGDLIPIFPRDQISPALNVLRGHGFITNPGDGRTFRIAKIPVDTNARAASAQEK